jgi:hypothetical protein
MEREGDIVAVAVFRGQRGRSDLRARLSEFAERMIWDNIVAEDHTPTLETWRAFLNTSAEEESLRSHARPA